MKHKPVMALCYGWTVILALTLLVSVCLAFILRFTELNEPTLSTITLIIGLAILFIGGCFAGSKSKAMGWLIGIILGIGFSLFICFVQYLGYDDTFSLAQLWHHFGFLIAALIGGIIGVNFVGKQA